MHGVGLLAIGHHIL